MAAPEKSSFPELYEFFDAVPPHVIVHMKALSSAPGVTTLDKLCEAAVTHRTEGTSVFGFLRYVKNSESITTKILHVAASSPILDRLVEFSGSEFAKGNDFNGFLARLSVAQKREFRVAVETTLAHSSERLCELDKLLAIEAADTYGVALATTRNGSNGDVLEEAKEW